MRIPNIYESKNLKLFIAIPIALLLFGLYFSTRINLDSSLSGGVAITLQTNTTVQISQIASQVSSVLHVSNPQIQTAPGGIQVTLSANKTLVSAYNYQINFFEYLNNYSTGTYDQAIAAAELQKSPGNESLISNLSTINTSVRTALGGMIASLRGELNDTAQFGVVYAINTSNPTQMQGVAVKAYTNASNAYEKKVISGLHSVVGFSQYSYQQISPTLASNFLASMENVLIVAFVLVFIAVFFVFKSLVPSATVVFGAANDLVVALGAMGLFGIPLGVTSIAGLLMIIGYAIDVDVLAAIRILKRTEGRAEERAYGAMRTGMTMTVTATVSFGVLFVVSLFTYVPTYYEISGVVLFGLIGSLFTTWFGNAPMILMYKRRKERRAQ